MKLNLKKLPVRRDFPSNELAIELESKFIDYEIERKDKLKDLVDECYSKSKYVERVFEIFDVSFDEGYSDVVEFINAKKGTIKTSIPFDDGKYKYNEDGTKVWMNKWTFLEYEVAHYDIDLDKVYTFEEVKLLIDEKKIVLLSSHPYKNVHYEFPYQLISNDAQKELTTIEGYNYENIYKNGISNNEVVIGMIVNKFNRDVLRGKLNEIEEELLSRLQSLKEEAKSLERACSERMYNYTKFGIICNEKIKKIQK